MSREPGTPSAPPTRVAAPHGARTLTLDATGSSMRPCLRPGDKLQVVPCDPLRLPVGSLAVVVQRDGRLVAHRVRAWLPDQEAWLLQGDALGRPDPPVRPAQVLGRVAGATRAGRPLPLFDGRFARTWLHVLGLIQALRDLTRPLRSGTP